MGNTKMITIFNQRLCGYLMMKGFVLVAMSEHQHCAGKNVFFFIFSDELQKSIQEYKTINISNILNICRVTNRE